MRMMKRPRYRAPGGILSDDLTYSGLNVIGLRENLEEMVEGKES
jgi:hypothetical protein